MITDAQVEKLFWDADAYQITGREIAVGSRVILALIERMRAAERARDALLSHFDNEIKRDTFKPGAAGMVISERTYSVRELADIIKEHALMKTQLAVMRANMYRPGDTIPDVYCGHCGEKVFGR